MDFKDLTGSPKRVRMEESYLYSHEKSENKEAFNSDLPKQYSNVSFSNNPQNRAYILPKETESDQSQKIAGFSVNFLSVATESFLSHPCTVIRRQCQVHTASYRYHINPCSLVPVLVTLLKRQGLSTLWKGSCSIFILRGLACVLETAIAELTPLPREVVSHWNLKQILEHLALKGLTFALLTPFYCASLVETVQSDIASEKPGVLDTLKEGVCRFFRWGTPHSKRLLPIWVLVGPTMIHHVAHYALVSVVQSLSSWVLLSRCAPETHDMPGPSRAPPPPEPVSSAEQYLCEMTSAFFGNLVADVLLYPSETIIHRLYLQGTRTIIDNLDTGTSVTPVLTTYEGPVDCFHTIVQCEGAAGLFKGFGALVLQYTLQGIILRIAYLAVKELNKASCQETATQTQLRQERLAK